ncbi:hypothetical protein Q4485_15750 [Granulosicoccaceae sp. 1_MG-2023]|nr:hypothetical protein [Granulosicoccaceae sp. 1_MG-2023]
MSKRTLRYPLACAACLLSCTLNAQTLVTLEGGMVDSSKNDVAIPGNSGTRFDLDEAADADPAAYVRLELEKRWGDDLRHSVRLVYAPLRIESDGQLDAATDFNGDSFAAGPVETTYQFDAHRITYRYRVYATDTSRLQLGVTGLVRDAEIRLQQDATDSSKSNVGFVPLLHLKGDLILTRNWNLALEIDGLAAPQGRAFDISLRGEYAFTERVSGYLGYRLLDGGADNDEVYNFARFHFAAAGLRFDFQ